MTISILLAQQIAQLFLMIFMGFLIVKAGLLKDEDSKVLSKIVLYLIIPCVILNAFQVDYTPETVRGLLVAFAASLLMQVVLLFAVSALGRVFHLEAVEITSVYYSNSGNLIVPLVTAVLGAEWVLYSCVYMSVQLVFFWTHCKKVISREASYDWKKIVLNLNIISIYVGYCNAASDGNLITINRKTLSRFPFQRSIDSVFYYPISTFFPSNANP